MAGLITVVNLGRQSLHLDGGDLKLREAPDWILMQERKGQCIEEFPHH